ncbi:hypothetical protein EYF80_060591 [Liparis tanakae]|uniref:Secreted protein n=1 Tax=Liparis tanakae TaxID=230148 RepID=A0A4Z2EL09_9TELE|nr:hypothetical protein EYF80_060591 [Liparis tanakae]
MLLLTLMHTLLHTLLHTLRLQSRVIHFVTAVLKDSKCCSPSLSHEGADQTVSEETNGLRNKDRDRKTAIRS